MSENFQVVLGFNFMHAKYPKLNKRRLKRTINRVNEWEEARTGLVISWKVPVSPLNVIMTANVIPSPLVSLTTTMFIRVVAGSVASSADGGGGNGRVTFSCCGLTGGWSTFP